MFSTAAGATSRGSGGNCADSATPSSAPRHSQIAAGTTRYMPYRPGGQLPGALYPTKASLKVDPHLLRGVEPGASAHEPTFHHRWCFHNPPTDFATAAETPETLPLLQAQAGRPSLASRTFSRSGSNATLTLADVAANVDQVLAITRELNAIQHKEREPSSNNTSTGREAVAQESLQYGAVVCARPTALGHFRVFVGGCEVG